MARKPFRLPERIVTLVFTDDPYQGLEIDVSLTVPQSTYWRIAEMVEEQEAAEQETGKPPEETPKQERESWLLFGKQIRAWRTTGGGPALGFDGSPIPATAEAFADALDPITQRVVRSRWLEAVQSPPAPLSPGPRKRRTSARS